MYDTMKWIWERNSAIYFQQNFGSRKDDKIGGSSISKVSKADLFNFAIMLCLPLAISTSNTVLHPVLLLNAALHLVLLLNAILHLVLFLHRHNAVLHLVLLLNTVLHQVLFLHRNNTVLHLVRFRNAALHLVLLLNAVLHLATLLLHFHSII